MEESCPLRFSQQTVARTSKFHCNFFVLLFWILGLTEWFAVHQQEKIYDMRSWTVSRKHLLQSNYCKLFGWISSSDAKFLAHRRAKKEEWDTAESSTVLIFSLSSRKWQKYVFFYFFAVLSGQRRWYRKTETVKLEICLLVSWIMKVWRPRLIALEVISTFSPRAQDIVVK